MTDAPKHRQRMWLIAEYCSSHLFMGWHIYLRDWPERQRRNDDGSWGWLNRGHWLLSSAHALLGRLGISMRAGGDGSCDDDGYAELARRFRFGRQRLGGKPRGGVAVLLDEGGLEALPSCAIAIETAAVELRAAELAASYVPDLADTLTHGTDEEAIGWALHRDVTTSGRCIVGELHEAAIVDGVPRSTAAWAGWLAREIYDVIHDIKYLEDDL